PNVDPTATVQEIVETIQEWAINTDLRRFVGHNCQERAIAMFREERMLDSYIKLIKSVIRSPIS
ncbi:hypothetical protein, partial [Anabaena sp. UHCC 0451]|uniref:glycosyltransferase n=1 Tax=Anabaena sp. UHCC 0451 TaxID=2055235 RepID=UPI002B1F828A